MPFVVCALWFSIYPWMEEAGRSKWGKTQGFGSSNYQVGIDGSKGNLFTHSVSSNYIETRENKKCFCWTICIFTANSLHIEQGYNENIMLHKIFDKNSMFNSSSLTQVSSTIYRINQNGDQGCNENIIMPEEREDWKKIQSNQITPEAGIFIRMTIHTC